MSARRALGCAVVVVAALVVVVAVAVPDGKTAAHKRLRRVSVSIGPALRPPYRASVPDYTVRCGKLVSFRASVPAGRRVAVDGAAPASGEIRRKLALKPGQAFRFAVDGAVHNVRCVPADFPRWRVQGRGVAGLQWLVFAPDERKDKPGAPYSAIADSHGVPVWWMKPDGVTPANTRLLPDGTVTWARLGGPFSATWWDHVKLDGTPLQPFKADGPDGADGHDIINLPNGHRVMIIYRPRHGVDLRSIGGPRSATVFDGVVQELTPEGKLVWQWSTEGHVKLRETAFDHSSVSFEGKTAYDLIHMNSVRYDGPNLVFSGKGVNAVYAVRRSTGKILWKLGGTHRRESLRVRRDPFGRVPLAAQHDARILPDGTLSVHDNGEFQHRRLPRIARYRIDTRRRTATLVEDVRDKRVHASYCCGGGTRLRGGRWLISWGANSLITELDTARRRHRPLFTIKLPRELFSYRVQGVAPGVVSRDALRAGMDAMHQR